MYKLLSKYDPDVLLSAYAYQNYDLAPRHFKLVRNIRVCWVPQPYVPYTAEWRAHIHAAAKGWRESGCTFGYRPNILDGYAMPFDISDDIYDEFHQVWSGGTMDEYEVDGPNCSFATQGPFIYMLCRMAVHPVGGLRPRPGIQKNPIARRVGGQSRQLHRQRTQRIRRVALPLDGR